MPRKKTPLEIWEPTAQEAREIANDVRAVVARERSRGWAFRNERGCYRRLDEMDRLVDAKIIDRAQYTAGRRYGREYSEFFDIGRYTSTLEYRRSDRHLSDRALSAGLFLNQARRDGLGGRHDLVLACDTICGRGQPASPAMVGSLHIALSRLARYYATPLDEGEIAAAAPKIRTLRDRAAQIVEEWAPTAGTMRTKHHFNNWKNSIRLLCEAQGDRCAICGGHLERDGASMDHVIPNHRGGRDEPGNITATHLGCNKRKGAGRPKPYQLDILRSVNLILGWEEEDLSADDLRYQRLMDAASRLANPSPAPAPIRKRTVRPKAIAAAAQEQWNEIAKPSRDERHMHDRWLAKEGVLRSSRTRRSRGVNAGRR